MMSSTLALALLAFWQEAAPVVARERQEQVMTGEGWLFMSAAWVFILVLVCYTFSKVLLAGRKK